MSTLNIQESLAGVVTPGLTGSAIRLRLIDAGQGSTAVYTEESLEQAAKDKVFPAGTHLYWDHPTVTESMERPERSLRDLAAVLESDAEYNPSTKSLDASARVYPGYREAIKEMGADIGASIRAVVETDTTNEAGLPVVSRFVESLSVDFVTKAGRGGKVLEIMESERRIQTQESTYEQLYDLLRSALKTKYITGEEQYVWVLDFDDNTVWFQLEINSTTQTYQQTYQTAGDTGVTLTGVPVTAVRVVTYVPTSESETPSPPARDTTAETSSGGDSMPQAVDKAGQVTESSRTLALEAERTAAIEESKRLQQENVKLREAATMSQARAIIAESGHGFDRFQAAGLVAELPLVQESGELDVEAFEATVAEAAAELQAASGAGTPRGLGVRESTGGDLSDSELDAELANIGKGI